MQKRLNYSYRGMGMFRSRGFVLITVILVLSVTAGVLAQLASGVDGSIDRATALSDQRQAYLMCLSAEQLAGQVLLEDQRQNRFDHASDLWARRLGAVPVDAMSIESVINDMQAKVNLNQERLHIKNEVPFDDINPYGRAALLSRTLEYQAKSVSGLALRDALMDWQDPDADPRSQGYESLFYRRFEPYYRAADSALVQRDELRLIEGFSEQDVKRLQPVTTILPYEASTVNVNTASAAILRLLIPELSASEIDRLLVARASDPWASVGAFVQDVLRNGAVINSQQIVETWVESSQSPIGVSSHFFELVTHVDIANYQMTCRTLLQRTDPKPVASVRVLSRTFQRSMEFDSGDI